MGKNKIIDDLEKLVDGRVVSQFHPDYNARRTLFNSIFDKRPIAIVDCTRLSDLHKSLAYVVENEVPFCVRAGGHSAAGHSTINDGVVINLRGMNHVLVQSTKKFAVVGAGATMYDFDREAQLFGLATTGGIISNTGVAGLTLGGGLGWLMGKYGVACDNLVSAEVLLANGEIVHCSDDDNADLMWALRGGGGNFGIVTNFGFKLHEVQSVLAGSLYFNIENAVSILKKYRDITSSAPEEITYDLVLTTNKSGEKIITIDLCWCNLSSEGKQYISQLIDLLKPIKHNVKPRSYLKWQQYFDDDLRAGRRSYWRGAFLENLSDQFIDIAIQYFRKVPSRYTMLTFDFVHGEASRENLKSCYSRRAYQHVFLINTNWSHPEEDQENKIWANNLYDEVNSLISHNHGYVNYLSNEGKSRIHNAYSSESLRKLVKIKKKYDPNNVFCYNNNIPPNLVV